MKIEYEAREKYIDWIKGENVTNIQDIDDVENKLKKCYENEIEEEKKKAIEIINKYIELSHINWKELDNAYGRL